jgi:hypothetical protein
MVVLPSTGNSRYHNCCIDDGTSTEYFGYALVEGQMCVRSRLDGLGKRKSCGFDQIRNSVSDYEKITFTKCEARKSSIPENVPLINSVGLTTS